jgi:transposase-like protein
MERIAEKKKNVKQLFEAMQGDEWMNEELKEVMNQGKRSLDACMMEIGKMMAETLMLIEREQIAGSDYHPSREGLQKWGFQNGSIYLGDQKVKVAHPRLRAYETEMALSSYERLKKPKEFSDQMLLRAMRGLSGRKYRETVTELGAEFGISPSSISNRLIEATAEKLKALRERDLSDFQVFAIFLDTIHRGKAAFTIALGIDFKGKKRVLGFWEGATENKEIAQALLSDMESRGLQLTEDIIFVTDGGKGIIRALKSRMGSQLIHQRCTIHKDRNLQRHLPKRFREEAHRRFSCAIQLKDYEEAKHALEDFEKWLRQINESAADSLLEAKEEILVLHRLEVPALLRRTLHSTNPIESMFGTVRFCERNVKRHLGSKMSQRWLAAILLHAEASFKALKGFRLIPEVIERIKQRKQNQEIALEAV